MKNRIQSGFTLVELIVVIVILGILAAVALPKFMGLEREARVASVRSMGGTNDSGWCTPGESGTSGVASTAPVSSIVR